MYGTFSANQDNTASIDGQAANVTYQSTSQINILLDSNLTSGSHTVTVSNPGGTSSQSSFTIPTTTPPVITVAPTITGIQGYDATTNSYTNGTAVAGKYLILYGSFSANNDNQVKIDGQAANIIAQTGNQINILLDSGLSAGQHNMVVSNPGGTSSQSTFSVTAPAQAPTASQIAVVGTVPTARSIKPILQALPPATATAIMTGRFPAICLPV